MVTVGMNYRIIEGKEAEFETVFFKVIDIMKGLEGHVETHLYRDVRNPTAYLIISEWNNQASFEAFTTSQQFRNVADWGKSKILAGQPKHEVYGGSRFLSEQRCPVGAH